MRPALSASAQRQLLDHMETLKFIGVPARTAAPEVRRALEEAWFEGATLRIRYAGARETTTRPVRITSVVMERSETLVNAHDLEKGRRGSFGSIGSSMRRVVRGTGGRSSPESTVCGSTGDDALFARRTPQSPGG